MPSPNVGFCSSWDGLARVGVAENSPLIFEINGIDFIFPKEGAHFKKIKI